ncbi:hypothetical protein ES703_42837 [subsurface metagenome]
MCRPLAGCLFSYKNTLAHQVRARVEGILLLTAPQKPPDIDYRASQGNKKGDRQLAGQLAGWSLCLTRKPQVIYA